MRYALKTSFLVFTGLKAIKVTSPYSLDFFLMLLYNGSGFTVV